MSNPFDLEEILPSNMYGFSKGGKVPMRKSNVKSIVGQLIQHFYSGGQVQPEQNQQGNEMEEIESDIMPSETENPELAQTEVPPLEAIPGLMTGSKSITGGTPTEDYGEDPEKIGRNVFGKYAGGKISKAYSVPDSPDMSLKEGLNENNMGRTTYNRVGKKYDLLENL